MKSIKKEIMEEFKKKFYKKLVNQEIFEGFFDTSDFDEAESFLSQALTRIEEAVQKEDIDFLEEKGYMVAAEFIREHFVSPSEEKECKHHCHSCEQYRLNGDCWCDDLYEHEPTCIHCHSPKKEKRKTCSMV